MGFRSTFVTEQYNIHWPDWFVKKYEDSVWFHTDQKGAISSKFECKTYFSWTDLVEHIQMAINWKKAPNLHRFVLVFLHECGGITRVQIEEKNIFYSVPAGWEEPLYALPIGHEYCYGCSDVEKVLKV